MHILFIYPPFSNNGFWNDTEVCKLIGAKYSSPPLGLLTVAAYLPQEWSMKLIDLNVVDIKKRDPLLKTEIIKSDFVFVGGMLPQRSGILNLIDQVHALNKKIIVGGSDPTSMPELYQKADYLFIGEIEETIVKFVNDLVNDLNSTNSSTPIIYKSTNRPQLKETLTPRFDLLEDITLYLQLSLQFSRGCPHNCEFCDAIQLFGREPRCKSSKNMIAELQSIFDLGYHGLIYVTDDNFVGHKQKAKEFLKVLIDWQEKNGYPFFLSTEASITIAYDDELLELMRRASFRFVFIGLETVDQKVLATIEKEQNFKQNLLDSIRKIHFSGISVIGSFILGFDHETKDSGEMLVKFISDSNIVMAQVGLLDALPNTRLTNKLLAENRLLRDDDESRYQHQMALYGLNFQTIRPKKEIINDQYQVLSKIYSNKAYFDRILALGLELNIYRKYSPPLKHLPKFFIAFWIFCFKLGPFTMTFLYFLRNMIILSIKNPKALEIVIQLMAMFVHYKLFLPEMLAMINKKMELTDNGKQQ
ncbi:MAG: B12-binding domain-containing radical SAM protein [Oligoflexia bacterium]|nr:B12-binding domain-containing radical SAM protein [Oligoflexia bacterium]